MHSGTSGWFGSKPVCWLWRISSIQGGFLAPCSASAGQQRICPVPLQQHRSISSPTMVWHSTVTWCLWASGAPPNPASRSRAKGRDGHSGENHGMGMRETFSLNCSSRVFLSQLQAPMPTVVFLCTPDQLCDQNEQSEFRYPWTNHSFNMHENFPGCLCEVHRRKKGAWGPSLSVWKSLSAAVSAF